MDDTMDTTGYEAVIAAGAALLETQRAQLLAGARTLPYSELDAIARTPNPPGLGWPVDDEPNPGIAAAVRMAELVALTVPGAAELYTAVDAAWRDRGRLVPPDR